VAERKAALSEKAPYPRCRARMLRNKKPAVSGGLDFFRRRFAAESRELA
jgi:hypothetical protein